MAASVSPTSPTSFQLRWALRSRKSYSLQSRVRFSSSDRSRRVRLVRADGGRGGERQQTSSSDGSVEDSFSGWFDEDDDRTGCNGKKDYGGIIGGGLAGIFLAAGVTFAILSFNSKQKTGVKLQMKPLTSQEELLLSSNYQNETVETTEEQRDMALPNDGIQGLNSDSNGDSLSCLETVESASERRHDELSSVAEQYELSGDPLTTQQELLLSSNDQNEKVDAIEEQRDVALPNDGIQGPNSDSNGDIISYLETVESASQGRHDEPSAVVEQYDFSCDVVNISPNEDLLADPDSYPQSTVSAHSNKFGESHLLHSSGASTLNLDSGNTDVGGAHEDMSATSFLNLPSNGIDLENLSFDNQDSFFSSKKEKSKSSAEASGQLLSEPLASSDYLDSESNAARDPQADTNNVLKVVDDVSNDQTKESDDKLQSETVAGTPLDLGHDIIENIPSRTNSVSVLELKEEVVALKEITSSATELSPINEADLVETSSSSVLIKYSDNPDSCRTVEINRGWSLSEPVASNNLFSHAGIPAPCVVSSAQQVPLGKVLVPAEVGHVQGQALAALQVLKVIEDDVRPGDICARREYARWLVSASSALSRNIKSKVYPAMYIENVTELAFDDITPSDPDFPYIQGLAEAGLISSKLSCSDPSALKGEDLGTLLFSPERPLSRQDLVSWKMALEKRLLPEVDKKIFHQLSGYIDVDKIHGDAWPSIIADLSSGDNGIISLAFGYTRLFQPDKPVTKAQAAVALSTGDAAEVVGEELIRIEAEALAETAVAAHTALVAEVEKDLNVSFEKELTIEREKIDAIEKLAEEARVELEKVRKEREEENNSLIKGRAAVESEMEVLSRLRNEVEEQLQNLFSNKMEISIERDRAKKLLMEAEREKQTIVQLQYDLEVERKALAMARTWAEDEAKRAREHAKALEEARERWERCGIKVIVDEELRETASEEVTFLAAGKKVPVEDVGGNSTNLVETINFSSRTFVTELMVRAEHLMEKLKAMMVRVKGKSVAVIQIIIKKITAVVSVLKCWFSEASQKVTENQAVLVSRATKSMQDLKESASAFGSGVKDGTRRAVEECKENMDKITQKFKT